MPKSIFDSNRITGQVIGKYLLGLVWKSLLIGVVSGITLWLYTLIVGAVTDTTTFAALWLGLGATLFLALGFILRPGKEHWGETIVLLGLVLTMLSLAGDLFLSYIEMTKALGWQGWYVLLGSVVLGEGLVMKFVRMK